MNRIAITTTILLLTALVLAGCGSTRDHGQARDALDGADGQVGQIRLLNVNIAAPGGRGSFHLAGDNAALLLTIANDGKAVDAHTDGAGQVVFRNGDAAPSPQLQVPLPPGGTPALTTVTGPNLVRWPLTSAGLATRQAASAGRAATSPSVDLDIGRNQRTWRGWQTRSGHDGYLIMRDND